MLSVKLFHGEAVPVHPQGTAAVAPAATPVKALLPTNGGVALSKVTLARLAQSQNALTPTNVTLLGMVILVKLVQS